MTTLRMRRRFSPLALGPSGSNPVVKGRERQAKVARKIGRAPFLSVVADYAIVSPVSHLLVTRGPSAVVWGIVAKGINAINGMIRRGALSHVGKKVLKRFPSLANANATTAVVLESCGVGIRAAVAHSHPNIMRWRSRLPVRSPVCADLSALDRSPPTAFLGAVVPATGAYSRRRFPHLSAAYATVNKDAGDWRIHSHNSGRFQPFHQEQMVIT